MLYSISIISINDNSKFAQVNAQSQARGSLHKMGIGFSLCGRADDRYGSVPHVIADVNGFSVFYQVEDFSKVMMGKHKVNHDNAIVPLWIGFVPDMRHFKLLFL